MRWALGLTAGLALCVMLGACGGPDEPKGQGYTPIPDKELFAQIGALPGVTVVDLKFRDTFEEGNDYVGEIEVDPSVDAARVLDRALAILRQGRWQASMTVFAMQNGRRISPRVLGLNAPTDRRLTGRYGEQPGDGRPPKAAPSPTP